MAGMEIGSETFVVEFYVSPDLLDNPQWEEACWDRALSIAHERGKIPVGPILITHEEVTPGSLVEGVPMAVTPMMLALGGKVLKVTASCMIGAEL